MSKDPRSTEEKKIDIMWSQGKLSTVEYYKKLKEINQTRYENSNFYKCGERV